MKIKNLEAADAMPFRQSMRKSSGYDSWEPDFRGLYFDSRHILRFIEKNTGKQFDEVYADFLNRLSNAHFSKDVYELKRDHFLSFFEECGYWLWFAIIDGIITACDNRRKRDRNVYIYPDDNEHIYRFNSSALTDEQDKQLRFLLGPVAYCHLMEDYIDEVFYTKHRYAIADVITRYKPTQTGHYRHSCNYTWNQSFFDDYFTVYNTSEPTVLKSGTSKRKKHDAEKSAGERKMMRDEKRKRKECIDEVYQKDFERRKRMDAENDDKIVSHGFDLKMSV